MSPEFNSIRAEMLKWQDRRFDLLKHSTNVVTGLLGFKPIFEQSGLVVSTHSVWPLVFAVRLLYLTATNLLTRYAGVANTKLAAYRIVFHGSEVAGSATFLRESRLATLIRPPPTGTATPGRRARSTHRLVNEWTGQARGRG